MHKMVSTSENIEATIVALGLTAEATAVYLATQTFIPEPYKTTIVGVLGIIGFVILAFWKAKVNPAP